MSECPGPCNRDWRRARALDPSTEEQPTLGEPVWCGPCQARIRDALGDIVECYCLLEDEKGTLIGMAGPDVARHSLWSPPDDQDDAVRLLTSWDTTIRELHEDRVGDWRQVREPVVLSRVVASLRSSLEWALAHKDIGVDFGREVLRLRSRLRERTSSGAGATRMNRICPRCGLRTLAQEPGSDYIACGNCGRLLTLAEYDELAARSA